MGNSQMDSLYRICCDSGIECVIVYSTTKERKEVKSRVICFPSCSIRYFIICFI